MVTVPPHSHGSWCSRSYSWGRSGSWDPAGILPNLYCRIMLPFPETYYNSTEGPLALKPTPLGCVDPVSYFQIRHSSPLSLNPVLPGIGEPPDLRRNLLTSFPRKSIIRHLRRFLYSRSFGGEQGIPDSLMRRAIFRFALTQKIMKNLGLYLIRLLGVSHVSSPIPTL